MPGPSPTSRRSFTSAMAAAVTGVNIVTTDGPGGRFGLTVSSMASVSAEPPMLLVSIHRRSPVIAAIRENGVFGLSVLGIHHAELADTFAGRPGDGTAYDFTAGRWRPAASGAPLRPRRAAVGGRQPVAFRCWRTLRRASTVG